MGSIAEIISTVMISQLDKGIVPWRKTWSGVMPINYMTRRMYTGVNLLMLPYGGEYLSFLQVKDLGGKIKKGEKAHVIVFFKSRGIKSDEDEKPVKQVKTEDKKYGDILRYTNVFHLSQIDGLETKIEARNKDENEVNEEVEKFIRDYIERSGVKLQIIIGEDKAYYNKVKDTIVIPDRSQFESNAEYYSTLLHEIGHSTGNANRLDRYLNSDTTKDSSAYGVEELVAELFTLYVMNNFGLDVKSSVENSIAYINFWKNTIKRDKRVISKAHLRAKAAWEYARTGKIDE